MITPYRPAKIVVATGRTNCRLSPAANVRIRGSCAGRCSLGIAGRAALFVFWVAKRAGSSLGGCVPKTQSAAVWAALWRQLGGISWHWSENRPPRRRWRPSSSVGDDYIVSSIGFRNFLVRDLARGRHATSMMIRQWSLDPQSSISFIAQVVTASCSPWDAKTWSS